MTAPLEARISNPDMTQLFPGFFVKEHVGNNFGNKAISIAAISLTHELPEGRTNFERHSGTEMYFITAGDGAFYYFDHDVQAVRTMLLSQGDFVGIPSGLVHSIGPANASQAHKDTYGFVDLMAVSVPAWSLESSIIYGADEASIPPLERRTFPSVVGNSHRSQPGTRDLTYCTSTGVDYVLRDIAGSGDQVSADSQADFQRFLFVTRGSVAALVGTAEAQLVNKGAVMEIPQGMPLFMQGQGNSDYLATMIDVRPHGL